MLPRATSRREISQAHQRSPHSIVLFSSRTVIGSSFVLFGVSMELIVGQFRSGESGYSKRFYPWTNAI